MAPSPDGSRILFERDVFTAGADFPTVALTVIDASGRNARSIETGCTAPCVFDLEPGWTPDGKHITFSRIVGPFDLANDSAHSAVLWTTTTRGTELRRLSEPGIDGIYEDYHARWSPDGKTITFQRVRNADLHAAIFAMDARGGNVRQLTPWELDATAPDPSPAEAGPTKGLVAFDTYGIGVNGTPPGSSTNIATVPINCKTLADCQARIRYVTNNGAGPVGSFSPSWSPEGTRLVVSEVDPSQWGGFGEIWTIKPDGSDRRRVTNDAFGDWRVSWAPATPDDR